MKNNIGLVAIAICTMSCSRVPDKEAKAVDKKWAEANQELKDARLNREKAAKAKTVAEWNDFKKQSDTSLSNMEDELKNMEVKLVRNNAGNEELREALIKAKSDLKELRNKLQQQQRFRR